MGENVKIRVPTDLGGSPNRTQYLSPLLSHLWSAAAVEPYDFVAGDTRIGGQKTGAAEMQGGGNGGGGDGRGALNNYNNQNNFTGRPPPRQNQGNFQFNQNRGQNFYPNNQYRGQQQNPNFNYQHSYNSGNPRTFPKFNNQQRTVSAESIAVQSGGQKSYVPKASMSVGTVETEKQKQAATASGSDGGSAKLQCFKCYIHGTHVTKDCKADVLGVN